jgi:hypothetical protein
MQVFYYANLVIRESSKNSKLIEGESCSASSSTQKIVKERQPSYKGALV